MQVRELSTDDEIRAAFPLMAALRERIRDRPYAEDLFVEEVRVQEVDGYRLVGGFVDDKLVVLAGVRPGHTLARGPHAFVDDLVTQPNLQGRGYATALLRWVGRHAAENNLPRVYLDSRASALGFYDRMKFSFLTSIPCWAESAALAAFEPTPSEPRETD